MTDQSPASWGAYYHTIASRMALFRESNRALVAAADLRPGMTVVDLACGSGITSLAALEAVPEGLRLVLIDASASMIESAKQLLGDRVAEYHVADAAAVSALVPEKVDRVLCNLSLWYFQNPEGVVREVRKVLKPTGHLAFTLSGTYFNTGGGVVSPQWALMRGLADQGLIPRALPEVERLPNQRSIEGTLQGAGMKPFFFEVVDLPGASPVAELQDWVRLYPILEGESRAEAVQRTLEALPASEVERFDPKWRAVIFMAQPQLTAEEALRLRFGDRFPKQ